MSISHEQADHWQKFGWVCIPELLTAEEILRVETNLEFLVSPLNKEGQSLHYFENASAGPSICRTERFLEDSSYLKEVILGSRLLDIAALLTGEQVCLFKEKINYKQPGGAGFAAHQDASAYDFINYHVTCLICIDKMTIENGCLELAPGHRYGLMPADDSGCIRDTFSKTLDWQAVPLEIGDALFFDSYTPHRSGPNQSDGSRRAIYLTYNVASEGDKRAVYYENRAQLMDEADATGRISTIGHFMGENIEQRG